MADLPKLSPEELAERIAEIRRRARADKPRKKWPGGCNTPKRYDTTQFR